MSKEIHLDLLDEMTSVTMCSCQKFIKEKLGKSETRLKSGTLQRLEQ